MSETCRRASITSNTLLIPEFVIGFSQGKFLMDFVDVGSGKDRADQKVVGQYHLRRPELRVACSTTNVAQSNLN